MRWSIFQPLIIALSIIAANSGLQFAAQPAAAQQTVGQWQTLSPMPTARSEITATRLGGSIYVAGGVSRLGVSNRFERYDIATDKWQVLAPMPKGLHHTAIASIGGKIIMAGGFDGLDYRPTIKSAWMYDPGLDRWRAVADMPSPRAAHRMVAVDNRLYLVGGVGLEAKRIFIFDMRKGQWTKTRPLLEKVRHHLAVVVRRGLIYVIGGRAVQSTDKVSVFDPVARTWLQIAKLPNPKSGHTAAVLDGRIHVTGGEKLRLRATYTDHRILGPEEEKWWTAPPLPKGRHGMASVAVGNRWYLIGGANNSGRYTFYSLTNRVERYTALR